MDAVGKLSIILGIVGAIIGAAVTGAIWYGALRYWMGKRESREDSLGANLGRMQSVQDEHGRMLARQSERLVVVEHALDVRPQPLDYPVRG
jgi:hypothetical protein